MNKKISFPIVIIIIVVCAVLVGGIVVWQYLKTSEKEFGAMEINKEAEQLVKCILLNDYLEKIKCFSSIFEEEGYDKNLCERFYWDPEKEDCYTGMAIAKKDEELCKDSALCEALVMVAKGKEVPEEQFAKCGGDIFCYKYIFEEKGYNEILCGKIEKAEEKDYCYSAAAEVKKDEVLCLKINDEEIRLFCYIGVGTADETLCKKLRDKIRPDLEKICYYSVAKAKKDEKICEEIRWEIEKDYCYRIVAIAKEDETLCQNIERENIEAECYDDVYREVAISKKDETLCEKVKYKKGFCYEELALVKLDPKLCEKIEDKGFCYLKLAKLKTDESLCEKAGDEKNLCFIELAIYKGDSTLCEKIKGEDKDICYARVASSNEDETLCEKAGSLKESCYMSIATIKKDEALCEKAGNFKEKCYQYLKK